MSLAPLLSIIFLLSLILFPLAGSGRCWVAEASVSVGINEPSASGTNETGRSTILVVQHADESLWYTDYALRQLGIAHDTVKVSDFPKTDLSKYRIIIVGTVIGTLEEVKPYLDSKSTEIAAWVTSGGCLAVFGQYKGAQGFDLNGELRLNLGSGYYDWMLGKPGFVSVSSERVGIVNGSHPIMMNFTDADLSFWHSSADGYFVQAPGEVLAVHENYYTRPVLYAQILGKGKIVATGLDPDYHGFIYNGNGKAGRENAQNLLKAILDWFGEAETSAVATEISIFASASLIPIGYKIEFNGALRDFEGAPVVGEIVVLSYIAQGLETWIPITSVVTGSDGSYSATWNPSATGNFTVKAEYAGNGNYSGTRDVRSISVHECNDESLFFVESNSTVSAIAFDSEANEISFSVSGMSGTFGYIRFLISKALVANVSDLTVYIDEKPFAYQVISNNDSWILYFEYTHSTHDILVKIPKAPNLQPESSDFFTTALSIASIATLIVVGGSLIIYLKKRKVIREF